MPVKFWLECLKGKGQLGHAVLMRGLIHLERRWWEGVDYMWLRTGTIGELLKTDFLINRTT
jgi:hypothetical protein